jgi:uncharacterized membrane protein YphA (DoxX/SURF4 family)
MSTTLSLKRWADDHADAAWDLVRIYLGLGLFVKAVYFIGHREVLDGLLAGTGPLWIAPALVAHYVILAHLAGGLLLAAGLITRVAALVQVPALAGAVFYVFLPKLVNVDARQNLEFSALVLFLLLLFVLRGPGKWSVDAVLARRREG